MPQIDLGFDARGRAAGDDAPAGRRRENALRQQVASHVVDDDVHATLARQAFDLGDEVLRFVGEDFVRTQSSCPRGFDAVPGSGEDARTAQLGDLDGGARNTAARSVYEHGLPGPHASLVDEHLPGREKDERNRRDLMKRKVARIRQKVGVRHDDVARITALDVLAEDAVPTAQVVATGQTGFADAARDCRGDDDPIAYARTPGTRTERLDLTRDVGPNQMWGYSSLRPVGRTTVTQLSRGDMTATARIRRTSVSGPGSARSSISCGYKHFGTSVGTEDDGVGLHGRHSRQPSGACGARYSSTRPRIRPSGHQLRTAERSPVHRDDGM